MAAFETIAARFFKVQGFWTRIGVKVEITKPEAVEFLVHHAVADVVVAEGGAHRLHVLRVRMR